MFIDNKYYAWYKQLVASKNRVLDCYTEKHHIIPRCMRGDDSVENLVVLTAREHYIAHLLLTKCVSKKYIGMVNSAYVMMALVKDSVQKREYRINSRLFETRKIKADAYKRAYQHTYEARQVISEKLKGVPKTPFTQEHKNNISKSSKGKVPWNVGVLGNKDSDETKEKKRVARNSGNWKLTESGVKAVQKANTGKVTCFDKELLTSAKVSIEQFKTDNRERYITFRSTEYKEKYKGAENA